jgi:hypothetical protein
LAEHVGVKAPGSANKAMVFPAEALATSTALGPMLQASPSTSEYSINVVWGMLSPTLIMFCSLEKEMTHDCGSFIETPLSD